MTTLLPARTDPIWFRLELGAHLLLALGLLTLLIWWLRRHPDDRPHVAASLLLGAVWVPLSYWLLAPAAPTWLYTAIREGYTLRDVQMAAGSMAQNGVLLDRFWRPTFIPPDRSGTALDVLRIQLGLGGLAILLWWPIARRLARSNRGAAVVWLLAALNLNHLHSLISETEAPSAALYLVASVLPFAVLVHPDRSRPAAAIAGLTLGLCTAILGTSRLDLMGAGLLALLTGSLSALPRARAVEARWAAACDRALAAVRQRPWWLLLAPAAWLLAGTLIRPMELIRDHLLGELYWLRMAVDPLNPTWATLPVFAAAFVPLGGVLLGLAGALDGLRRPLRGGGLPLTVFILWGAYYAAAHGGRLDDRQRISLFELYRYAMLLAPIGWLWMARGWAVLTPALRDRPRAAAFACALCLLPPMPEAVLLLPHRHPRSPPVSELLPRFGLIDRDPQRQVRALLDLAERYPQCTLLTWSARWGAPPVADRGDLVRWQPSRARRPLSVTSATPDPRAALQTALQDAPGCVLWVEALDCQLDLPAPTACDLLRPDTTPIEQRAWPTRPYLHPEHGARWRPEVQWSVRAFPGHEP